MEEPEVVEVEEVEEVEAPSEPEPIAPEWVQIYEDLVSTSWVPKRLLVLKFSFVILLLKVTHNII